MKRIQRRFILLLLLCLMFAAPGLFAYYFYLHPNWLSSNTTNKGTFIRPPILLDDVKAPQKWQLMVWSPITCNETCLAQADKLARIRLALGRRLYDLDISVLVNDNLATMTDATQKLLQEQGIQIIPLSVNDIAKLTHAYNQMSIFIANPTHYLVLHYDINAAPDDIFHDIKKLLTKG